MSGVLFPGNYGAPIAPVETMEQAAYPVVTESPRIRTLKLPSKGQLEYTKELITVSLLILGLPWILRFLVTNPPGFAKSLSSVTP